MSLFTFADIDDEYAKDSQLKPEDVATLDEWQRNQPHLPAPFHPVATAIFLQNSNYSIEVAKQRIDTYFTFRTHCPDLFANCDPFAPDLQLSMKHSLLVVLPELTPEGYLVFIARFLNPSVKMFNFNTVVKMSLMICELTVMQRGYHRGCVIIIDMEGGNLSHLLKVNIMTMKKLMIYVQTVLPIFPKSLHFVNSLPFVDKLLALMRPFLDKQLQDALHVHYGDNSSIFKFVPKDILPVECGGSTFSATDYFHNVTRRNLEQNAQNFKTLCHLVVDESKRPGKPKAASDLFGVKGNFKQLHID